MTLLFLGAASIGSAGAASSAADASQSLWDHAVEKAAQNNVLSQDDYRLVADPDNQDSSENEQSAADKYSWIVANEDGTYSVDLSKTDPSHYNEVKEWTRMVQNENSNQHYAAGDPTQAELPTDPI